MIYNKNEKKRALNAARALIKKTALMIDRFINNENFISLMRENKIKNVKNICMAINDRVHMAPWRFKTYENDMHMIACTYGVNNKIKKPGARYDLMHYYYYNEKKHAYNALYRFNDIYINACFDLLNENEMIKKCATDRFMHVICHEVTHALLSYNAGSHDKNFMKLNEIIMRGIGLHDMPGAVFKTAVFTPYDFNEIYVIDHDLNEINPACFYNESFINGCEWGAYDRFDIICGNREFESIRNEMIINEVKK